MLIFESKLKFWITSISKPFFLSLSSPDYSNQPIYKTVCYLANFLAWQHLLFIFYLDKFNIFKSSTFAVFKQISFILLWNTCFSKQSDIGITFCFCVLLNYMFLPFKFSWIYFPQMISTLYWLGLQAFHVSDLSFYNLLCCFRSIFVLYKRENSATL